VLGAACMDANIEFVDVNQLHRFHQGCDSDQKVQTSECVSAAHRFCQDKHGMAFAAGLPQEASSGNFVIACMPIMSITTVKIN
jgi:hypothetical protein